MSGSCRCRVLLVPGYGVPDVDVGRSGVELKGCRRGWIDREEVDGHGGEGVTPRETCRAMLSIAREGAWVFCIENGR